MTRRIVLARMSRTGLKLVGVRAAEPDWEAIEWAWRPTTEGPRGEILNRTSPWHAYWRAEQARGVPWGRAYFEWTGMLGNPPLKASRANP